MKKLLVSFVIVGILIASLVTASIALTDFKGVYQEFVKSTRVDIATIEDINFRVIKFPIPYLVIDEIKQDGKVLLKDTKIKLSILSLLRFNPAISELEIGEATINLNNDDVNFLSHSEFIGELISKNALAVKAKIHKLKFIESDNDVALVIDDFTFSNKNETTSFEGTIEDVGFLKGSFEKSSDDIVFNMDLQDKAYSFKLNEIYKNSTFESGKAELKTTNLSNRIARMVPDFGNLEFYLSSNEEVKIDFDIKPIKQGVALESIVIDSNSLRGRGEMKLSSDPTFLSEINIEFSKLDIANWLKPKKDDASNGIVRFSANKRLDFSKSNLKASFVAKEIKLGEDNSLTNVNLKASAVGGKLEINDFSGEIDQGGSFKLDGAITQNSFRSLFDGRIVLSHKDLNDFAEFFGGKGIRTDKPIPFAFSSDIKFDSVDVSFLNFLIKTNEAQVTGGFSSKFIGKFPRTNASIRFTSANVDENSFPALSQAFNYAKDLRDGMKSEAYLNKFIPIRQISSISNFDITFDRVILNKKLYENVSFALELSPGKVLIEQLHITDGVDWIDANIALEAHGIRPNLALEINNGSMAVDFLSAPSMLALRQKILNDFDLGKIDISARFFLTKLYQGGFSLGRVTFLAKNDKNLIDISKFDADLLGGRLQSSGSILLEPYTLNFVYGLNSVQIDQIAMLLPKGMINSGGVMSANGMWSTNGEKLNEQLYNLYTKSNIAAKGITLNGFSIDNFVQLLAKPDYNIRSFNDDLNKTLLLGQTQISDLQAGVELSKGLFTLPSIIFKTKYSEGNGSATFNLYDFNIDASSVFSFSVARPQYKASVIDQVPAKMTVTAKGSFLNPKKEANVKELQELLKTKKREIQER